MWTLLDAVAIFLTVTFHQTMSTGLLVTECFFPSWVLCEKKSKTDLFTFCCNKQKRDRKLRQLELSDSSWPLRTMTVLII